MCVCYLLPSRLITDKKEGDGSHVVVMPTASKRGRKKKTTVSRIGPVGGPGNETLILAHLTAGGQVRTINAGGEAALPQVLD